MPKTPMATHPAPRHLADRLAPLAPALPLLLAAAVAAALSWPWLPRPPLGGPIAARYAAPRDGASWLEARYDADGRLVGWSSTHLAFLPPLRAVSQDLGDRQREILKAHYRLGPDDAPDLLDMTERLLAANGQVVVSRAVRVDVAGGAQVLRTTELIDGGGIFWLDLALAEDDQPLALDPPLPELPPAVAPGQAWASSGSLGTLAYRFAGRVLQVGPYSGRAGAFPDCFQQESRLTLTDGERTVDESLAREWFCAGVGPVERESLTPDGALVELSVRVADDLRPGAAADLPPHRPLPADGGAPADMAAWQVATVGLASSFARSVNSTIAPVYVPGDPPLALVATIDGDLTAFEVGERLGRVAWRFSPDGEVYSQPAVDLARGRIYFGSTDKRLYALDARGLFLWAFPTGDNIAARPLVAGDTIVVAGEDRTVYGVAAETGAEGWRYSTAGPLASGPALAGDLAIVGSDDGLVYALDVASGAERWRYEAGAPIEAPILVDGGVAYAATREGVIVALDAADGAEGWVSDPPAGPLRSAPAALGDALVAIDSEGALLAFDRASGNRRWRAAEDDYVGAPLSWGGALLAADEGGRLHAVGPDGVRQRSWPLAGPGAEAVGLTFGPAAGGGAAWLADEGGTLYRVGPAGGTAHAGMAWSRSIFDPPLAEEGFFDMAGAPVAYRDGAVVVSRSGRVLLAGAADGALTELGRLGDELGPFVPAPAVAGDRLLVASRQRLYAFDLAAGRLLWRAEGPAGGLAVQRPAALGGLALWHQSPQDVGAAGALVALDIATGAERWRVNLAAGNYQGTILPAEGVVYASSPPLAIDPASGALRWLTEVGQTVAGGALSPDGGTLYTLRLPPSGAAGEVVAVSTADGRVRWRAEVPGCTCWAFESLWATGDVVVVPGTAEVTALDGATGAVRWRAAEGRRYGVISLGGGVVWQLLADGRLVGLDGASGAVAFRAPTGASGLSPDSLVAAAPLLVGKTVIVGLPTEITGVQLP